MTVSGVIWRGPEANMRLIAALRMRVKRVCFLLEADIKSSMKMGGRSATGKKEEGVKLKKTGSFRSKPGEVPRVQTGTLKRSITTELHEVLPTGRVGSNVEYARALELGYAPRNLSPRPFLRPATLRVEPLAKSIFAERIDGM